MDCIYFKFKGVPYDDEHKALATSALESFDWNDSNVVRHEYRLRDYNGALAVAVDVVLSRGISIVGASRLQNHFQSNGLPQSDWIISSVIEEHESSSDSQEEENTTPPIASPTSSGCLIALIFLPFFAIKAGLDQLIRL